MVNFTMYNFNRGLYKLKLSHIQTLCQYNIQTLFHLLLNVYMRKIDVTCILCILQVNVAQSIKPVW